MEIAVSHLLIDEYKRIIKEYFYTDIFYINELIEFNNIVLDANILDIGSVEYDFVIMTNNYELFTNEELFNVSHPIIQLIKNMTNIVFIKLFIHYFIDNSIEILNNQYIEDNELNRIICIENELHNMKEMIKDVESEISLEICLLKKEFKIIEVEINNIEDQIVILDGLSNCVTALSSLQL